MKCLWPNLHLDVSNYQKKNEIKSVPLGMNDPEELNTRQGNQRTLDNLLKLGQGEEKVIKVCSKRLTGVLQYLHHHLESEVFTTQDRNTIEATRQLLSLNKLLCQCVESGFGHVANLTAGDFMDACQKLNIHEFNLVDKSEVCIQYRNFLKKLETRI
jgi:hypothetical protein